MLRNLYQKLQFLLNNFSANTSLLSNTTISYSQTIRSLAAEKGFTLLSLILKLLDPLLAQARNEFGDFLITQNKTEEAISSWSSAISDIFGVPNCVQQLSTLISAKFGYFEKLGIYNCLLGATIVAKIARYFQLFRQSKKLLGTPSGNQ